MPANSQGVWNLHREPPWNSAYTANANMQMAYWSAGPLGAFECLEPLVAWLEHAVEPGTVAARAVYDADGWVLHHMSDLYGYAHPRRGLWSVWPMAAAWLASQVWDQARFSSDDHLARQAQRLMAGAVRFVSGVLAEVPQGWPQSTRLVPVPSHSPENAYSLDGADHHLTIGATIDVQIARQLFEDHLEAAARFDSVDPALDRDVADGLARLADPVVSESTGRLQEWLVDFAEADPAHRHVSHLFGLYPADQIDPIFTPALADAARRTLEARQAARRSVDEGDAFTAVLENAAWSHIWLAAMWARLGDGDRALEHLDTLIDQFSRPNGFIISHHVTQAGNANAIPAVILEMLVQSHRDEIRLLPALPASWPRGEVCGVRARGGHQIDLRWIDGNLEFARIEVGRSGPVRLRSSVGVRIEDGAGRTVASGPGLLEWQAESPRRYLVTLDR